ncbi:ABC transporter substrate-binding protein [Cohnella sp.]|uniref:ABC transporter substrate-binding protein n=1 Tax=Cohnella sp. TaxID=1883426 RepID=UPI003566D3BF
MKNALQVTTSLLLIVLFLFACGRSGNGDTTAPAIQTVKMHMSQGKYYDIYKKLQDKLKAEENIILDIQIVPDDQYYNLIQTQIAASDVPDIITENAPTQYEEVDAMKNMVDLSNEPWVRRLSNPELLKATDGKIYARPISSSSFYAAAYYNKKIFADLGLSDPTTYAGFLEILETIKTKGNGITPIYMSNKDTWTTQVFMTAGLPVLLGDKAQETWDKLLTNQLKWTEVPEFETVLNLYLDLYEKGYVNQDHTAATFNDAKAALAEGRTAIIYNGEWTVGDLVTKYNMDPDDIGAFVIPFGDRDLMATGSFVEGWLIPKDAKNIDGAKKVLDLLSQPAYMNPYFAEHPGSPGFIDVNGGEVAPAVKALEQKYIKGNKYIPEMNGPMSYASILFNENLWRPYVNMAAGEKTPEQVIESWQKKYTEYMKHKKQPGF